MDKDIKIWVGNLAAYNSGELVGEWFTLPTDVEEIYNCIFTKDELDENGQPQGDFEIFDYEAPFKIGPYESINKLNGIAEVLDSLSDNDAELVVEMYKESIIADLRDAKSYLDGIIRYDGCEDMGEVARIYLEDMYDEDSNPILFRHFDYDSYGEELESSGTYLFLNDCIVQYMN